MQYISITIICYENIFLAIIPERLYIIIMEIKIDGKKVVSAQIIAEKWGCKFYTVQTLCRKNRVYGSVQLGGIWWIPQNAQDPRMPTGRPPKKKEKGKQ